MKQTLEKPEQEMPPLAIEDRLMDAQQDGYEIVAAIRGFRVALSTLCYFYIELIAKKNKQEVEIGFWPGMTDSLDNAVQTLTGIKDKHPSVVIIHPKEPQLQNNLNT
ncbi:hypothetical protein I7Z51_004587 [Vibrio parahaemolyticus]|uniref:hypothetical protein n=1 Tax=Vibrio TaxID=662 RepID=UPI001A8C1010|nr:MULTISPECIES: hypothetical protein [Vibrio]EGQ7975605.1 hypothetical protein [Vibrio parahaemolyticus]MBO0211152.1 hypothetical protein [Vibrio sp. Vb0877]MCR9808282.1 hypothetical protein [Vibrio parahaemolyticus]MDW2320153.1 hypothetical protein [Vibrio sp. 1159]|eukprot:Anaeramoba_ignava/a483996_13.p1 GENE.a483996_13~~a483996_13.p1  ORF type:complete len:107 (-),score=17.91 a483996_13:98-418(-)